MFAEECLDQLRQKLSSSWNNHSFQSAIEELEAIREMDVTGAKEKMTQCKYPFTKSDKSKKS